MTWKDILKISRLELEIAREYAPEELAKRGGRNVKRPPSKRQAPKPMSKPQIFSAEDRREAQKQKRKKIVDRYKNNIVRALKKSMEGDNSLLKDIASDYFGIAEEKAEEMSFSNFSKRMDEYRKGAKIVYAEQIVNLEKAAKMPKESFEGLKLDYSQIPKILREASDNRREYLNYLRKTSNEEVFKMMLEDDEFFMAKGGPLGSYKYVTYSISMMKKNHTLSHNLFYSVNRKLKVSSNINIRADTPKILGMIDTLEVTENLLEMSKREEDARAQKAKQKAEEYGIVSCRDCGTEFAPDSNFSAKCEDTPSLYSERPVFCGAEGKDMFTVVQEGKGTKGYGR